jgi:phosphatidylinositol alpha 1,6-mannosyltransferase
VIVGDGPARPELEQLLPGAAFLGFCSGNALATAYASSDILLMPSTTETFGNVTLEAMASGLAPVCAAQGGACGLVQDGITGLLTRPRDSGDLLEKALDLLENAGKRAAIADQALQFARMQTWERIFDELFADYEEVIRDYRARHRRRAAA